MAFGRPSHEDNLARRAIERQRNFDALMSGTLRPLTQGTYAGATAAPAPKEAVLSSQPYERAAKALGYCMRCGRASTRKGDLDFCHADLGKGTAIKTDVRRGWPGCRKCHEEVGRVLIRPVRRAVEYLLGVMTRAAVLAAGSWPKRLPMWKEA